MRITSLAKHERRRLNVWLILTELGTYSSAIQCPKCHGGVILSTDPLDQDAPWKCRACAYVVTSRSMLLLVETVFKELDSINSNDVVGLEEFLGMFSFRRSCMDFQTMTTTVAY